MPPVEVKKEEKIWKISKDFSTKQKGDIAEARIAELVTRYGDTTLSCYKPISDDEGIDLIVKEKGSLKTMYVQIKSRFGDNPDENHVPNRRYNALHPLQKGRFAQKFVEGLLSGNAHYLTVLGK